MILVFTCFSIQGFDLLASISPAGNFLFSGVLFSFKVEEHLCVCNWKGAYILPVSCSTTELCEDLGVGSWSSGESASSSVSQFPAEERTDAETCSFSSQTVTWRYLMTSCDKNFCCSTFSQRPVETRGNVRVSAAVCVWEHLIFYLSWTHSLGTQLESASPTGQKLCWINYFDK